MLKFNETEFQNIMGMTPEETIEEYGVDVGELESIAQALDAGKFAYGGSPVSYFANNGLVFEGEFNAFSDAETRNSYLLIAFSEIGGMKVVDSKDKFGYVAKWDVEPLEQLKGTMSETFVPDLGVDVKPGAWYVVSDSGAMYGGVENSFTSEVQAMNWALRQPEIDLEDTDQVMQGEEIIRVYQAEAKLVKEGTAMQNRAMIQALGSEAEAAGELGEKISALILQAGKDNRINAGSYEGILQKLPSDALDSLYTKAVGLGMKHAEVDATDGSFDQKMAAVDFLKKQKDKDLIKQVNSFEKNANPIYRGSNVVFNLSDKGYLDALAVLRKAGFNESMTESEDGGLSKDRIINELVDEVGQAMEDSSADAFNGLMAFEAEVKGSDKDFYSWDELAEMFDRHGLNQDDLEWFRSMNESDGTPEGDDPFEGDQATLGESDLDLSGYDVVEVPTQTDLTTRAKNQNAYGFGSGRAHYPVRNAFQKIRVGDVVAWDEYQSVGKGVVKAKRKGGWVDLEDGRNLMTVDVIAIYRPKASMTESEEIGAPSSLGQDSFGKFVVDSILGNEQGVALVSFREGTSDQGDYAVVMNPDGRIMEGAPLPELSAVVSAHSSFNDALSKFQNKVAEVAKSGSGSAEFPVIGLQIDDPLASVTEGSSIVSTHEYRGKSADVYKEPSGKFRVRFYRDGKPMPQNTDLVTKDKEKAQKAAKEWIAEAVDVDSELLDNIGPALIRAQTVSKDERCVQHVNKSKDTGNYYVSDWYDYEETVASFNNGRLSDSNLPPGVEEYFNYFQESGGVGYRIWFKDGSYTAYEKAASEEEAREKAKQDFPTDEIERVDSYKLKESSVYSVRLTANDVWRVFERGNPVAVAGPFETSKEASDWIKAKGVNESFQTSPFEAAGLKVCYSDDQKKAIIHIKDESQFLRFQKAIDLFGGQDAIGKFEYKVSEGEDELYTIEVELKQYDSGKDSARFMKEMDPEGQQK